jgi:hypothetical protein
MAETDANKADIDNHFWLEFDTLPKNEQVILRGELRKVVKKLPDLAADLQDRVVLFSEKHQTKQAA